MINKNWTFALGILSLSTAMVAADQNSQTDKNPPMPMGVTSQPTGVITPPVAPAVNNGADVFLTADFIYWRAHQDGLEYAQTGLNYIPDSGQTLDRGTVKEANTRWEPGFKVGLGLEFEHDGWDLYAQYTWLAPQSHGHDGNSISNPAGSDLFALLGRNVLGNGLDNQLTSASSTWRLHFNVLDLEMGRNFFVSRYMTLRPHFGLKTSWLYQRFNTTYNYPAPYGNEQITTENVNQKQRSWGIGMRAGLDPVWHFARSWGLYGNFAMSALYTYYNDRLNDTGTDDAGTLSELVKQRRSYHEVTPVLELGLGLTYMGWFYDEAYMLEVKAGWEEQVWFNTNQFLDVISGSGNLTTQGFTMKVGFHF